MGVALNVIGLFAALSSGHTSALWWVVGGQLCIIVAIFLAYHGARTEYEKAMSKAERELRNPQRVIHEHAPPSFGVFDGGANMLTEEQARVIFRRRAEEEYGSKDP